MQGATLHLTCFMVSSCSSLCASYFPLVSPELFASSLSCLVVVCSELDQPFLSFLLAQDTWSFLNAPEKYRSLESVIIFHHKQEVTNPLSGVLNLKWHLADFLFNKIKEMNTPNM